MTAPLGRGIRPSADDGGIPRPGVVAAIRAALLPHADPVRAAGQQAYMKSTLPYLGLTSPVLKATLRPVLGDPAYRIGTRPEWEATVRALWDEATHREHWYAALTLLQHRHYRAWRDPDLLPLVRHLVVTGAWWDVVDEIATHVVRGLLLEWPQPMAPTLRSWAVDEHLWIRRVAMLAQVGAGPRTDPELLADRAVPPRSSQASLTTFRRGHSSRRGMQATWKGRRGDRMGVRHTEALTTRSGQRLSDPAPGNTPMRR